MLNKVPEITVYFWLIKVLCTTVGETFADNLNENLGLGLSGTSYLMGALLIAVLVFQFRSRRYVPGIYWLAVVLISVVGTLVSDNLVENYGVTLETTTIAFSAILICVFASWYAVERTLSVHTIFTTRRESFYWLAILFTFALGTSAGDFLSEQLELGYLAALGIFAGAIVVVAILHFGLRMNAILSFWLAYILTRPLGASIGDYLASPTGEGGLGLGTNLTSIIFLSAILALVVFLAISKRDVIRSGPRAAAGTWPPMAARRCSSSSTRSRRRRRCSRRCASGPPRGRPASSSWSPIPTTSPSTATAPTPATETRCWRSRFPRSKGRREARSPARSPTAPTPTTTSSRSWKGAPTGRSSWRRRPATSRTGSMSTSRTGYRSSDIRRRPCRRAPRP